MEIQEIRHVLHQMPELAFKEEKTAAFITDFLRFCGAEEIQTGIGGYGVVACFSGLHAGPEVLIRAELDGLAVMEESKLDYRSKKEGLSHACGHDGHMCILLNLAKWLGANPLNRGKVILVFQSAEEIGEGANAMISDSVWDRISPDYVFALHNLPGYKKHQIILKSGMFTASVKSLIVRFAGKTSHAAEPENGINPALAIAELLQDADKFSMNEKSDEHYILITPVYINMGEKAYGVSAGSAELHFTLRSWSDNHLEDIGNRLLENIRRIAHRHRLSFNYKWLQQFSVCKNDPEAVDILRLAASCAALEILEKDHAFSWGEDFGIFTQKFRGAMFGIGAGENHAALHNPDYDFPDELLDSGMRMFSEVIKLILN